MYDTGFKFLTSIQINFRSSKADSGLIGAGRPVFAGVGPGRRCDGRGWGLRGDPGLAPPGRGVDSDQLWSWFGIGAALRTAAAGRKLDADLAERVAIDGLSALSDESATRTWGDSKDHRPDWPQVIIAMAITRDGIPVRCRTFPGNTARSTRAG
jgi:hypothetical protein